jgi:ABC-2 type transport system ATP-binding protein/lipopolysaccharide transport system ATP-binding protein
LPTTSDIRGDDLAVDLRDVSVRYRLPRERVFTFKEFAIQWLRGRVVYDDLFALSHVSLRVRRGEALGIMGRNGAGKSTLLKVIARVLKPTGGSVDIRGVVAPLLELGAGFDMELSGRENVYLNGALLGRSRKEMQQRFDAIVEFSELAHFIDAPLRTYSTGMVARLGFAIATDVEPDILLVDEALSVGDIDFSRKCTQRIEEILHRGATLVLVSHSPDAVLQLCQHVVWLEEGKVVAEGPAREVVHSFVSHDGHPQLRQAVS